MNNYLPKSDPGLRENRRFQAVKLSEKHLSQSEIADRLNVSRQAIHKWLNRYQKKGLASLRSTKSEGRPAKVQFKVIKHELPRILNKGAMAYGYPNDVWTTVSVRSVMQKELNVSYHRDHVRKLLHRLDYSCQKPERRAVERNERKIRHWIRNIWPDVKKKP